MPAKAKSNKDDNYLRTSPNTTSGIKTKLSETMKTDTFKMPVEISHDLDCTDISTQEEDNYTDIREPVPTDDQDVNESSLMS